MTDHEYNELARERKDDSCLDQQGRLTEAEKGEYERSPITKPRLYLIVLVLIVLGTANFLLLKVQQEHHAISNVCSLTDLLFGLPCQVLFLR